MKIKYFLALLFLLGVTIPTFAQHRQPVATNMDENGKMLSVDFLERDLLTPEPQHVSIQKAVVFDFQCVPSQPNPPSGNDRFYCDSGTGQMVCKTSTGASCLGGGSGSGSVTSVGLAGPTGIPISNSPCTDSCTLTWAMPSGWVLGDLLIGNGSNSVARLAAPTTPDGVTEMLVNTPSSGATQSLWAIAGLAGRVVSGTTDTIVASDRTPRTVEYTSGSATAITVPDPASSGFNGNPSFVTIAEGVGPYVFTPQTSAVITYCDGSNCFAGQPSLTLQKGQYATWSSPSTSNWLVRVGSTQSISQPPVVNGLISGGGVVWTGLLNFTCSAATYAIGGTLYNSAQTNLTLAAADPTNPRIDVIAVNNAGACVAITGTPAGSPAAPSVDPTSQLSLTFVTIAANATTPTLTSVLVYDENSTPPTEWTCSSTAAFNCGSTNNPFHLTHDIEVTGATAGGNVVLTNNTTVNLSTYSTLAFNIRNKASWPAAASISICFLNASTIVGNCLGLKNGIYGFDQTNTTSYQQIVIPLANFALGSTVVNKLRFQVAGNGATGIGFYLDWIQIQSTLSGNGGSSFQLQVNGQNTQQIANLADNASVTWACTVANGVSTCKATAVGAPPSGAAGGDLTGTYPNPTVATVANQSAGDNSTKPANTAFVTTAINNAIAGVNPAVAVQAATAAILPNSPTYNNGVAGVGAFLTTASTNTALVVDGYTPVLLERILVKNQASAFQNGVYYVSQVSGIGVAWILTRALDYDTPSDMNNTGAIPVTNGTVNIDTSWVQTSQVTTVGTDAVTFTQFTLNPTTIVTASGTLTSGQIVTGAGSKTVQVGNLSGDVTTSGSTATTVVKVNGAVVPTSAKYLTTNSSQQFIAGDFPDVKIIPAANCPNAVAGAGWSYATSTFTAACRAGSNNLGGALQLAPSSGGAAQFRVEIPADWDSASQPFIRIEYGSGSNTSGTVIWTVASACTKADGSVTDDPAFNAESAFGTQTMAAASRAWSQTGQFTAITSGNNCVASGGIIIKLTLSGTASSAINTYQAVLTTQRLPTVQAN